MLLLSHSSARLTNSAFYLHKRTALMNCFQQENIFAWLCGHRCANESRLAYSFSIEDWKALWKSTAHRLGYNRDCECVRLSQMSAALQWALHNGRLFLFHATIFHRQPVNTKPRTSACSYCRSLHRNHRKKEVKSCLTS